MYKTHYDLQNNKWNVFKCEGKGEEFIDSFDELEDAQNFCDINNGALVSMQGKS